MVIIIIQETPIVGLSLSICGKRFEIIGTGIPLKSNVSKQSSKQLTVGPLLANGSFTNRTAMRTFLTVSKLEIAIN